MTTVPSVQNTSVLLGTPKVYIQSINTSTTTSTSTSSTAIRSVGISNGNVTSWLTFDDNIGTIIRKGGDIKIEDGNEAEISLPDGTIIKVEKDGSFRILDKDAKVIYRANRVRDFNPFVNVSDKLEGFIAYCKEQGVRQSEFMDLPIKLFIGWIVLQAALVDKEPEPVEIKLLPDLKREAVPHCLWCGKFIRLLLKRKKVEFCGQPCFNNYFEKVNEPKNEIQCISVPIT